MDLCSDLYVSRIAKYYRYLNQLKQSGVLRVLSNELAVYLNISPSQVRTDLSKFALGQSGYGYNVSDLTSKLQEHLGLNKINKMVLIGVGQLGQALLSYEGFYNHGFRFSAAFDINPQLKGKTFGFLGEPVRGMRELKTYLAKNPVELAVLAVIPESIQPVVDILVECEIKGIWNFAPYYPKVPENVVLENVHIQESLLKLAYRLSDFKQAKRPK